MSKDKKEINKKPCKEHICKLIAFGCVMGAVVSVGVLVKNKIEYNKVEIYGQVVELSEVKNIEKEVINLKGYIKKGMNPRDEYTFEYEYGGGSYDLGNGSHAEYAYTSKKENTIEVSIINEKNLVIFKKIINLKGDGEQNIVDIKMTKDNQVIITTMSDYSKNESTNIIICDLEGNILSKLEFKGVYIIYDIDNLNNKLIVEINRKKQTFKKIIKYNDKNKKIFEHEFDDDILKAYIQGDTTIVFTSPYNNKKSNDNVTLHKLDNKGNEIFNKKNENLNYNSIYEMIQLSDKNFLIEEYELVDTDTCNGVKLKSLIKIDSEFNEIWRKEINKMINNPYLIESSNGYFLILKESYDVQKENEYVQITSISKFDLSGEKVWTKYLGYDDNDNINILNGNYIQVEDKPYMVDDKVKIIASLFRGDSSEEYVEFSIDDNGNIN